MSLMSTAPSNAFLPVPPPAPPPPDAVLPVTEDMEFAEAACVSEVDETDEDVRTLDHTSNMVSLLTVSSFFSGRFLAKNLVTYMPRSKRPIACSRSLKKLGKPLGSCIMKAVKKGLSVI